MPWKECHAVDERLRFIARLLDGEKMAALCTEFGISRKTGDKIDDRHKDCGVQGLTDRSRRPYRHANQLPLMVEQAIVSLKREDPDWGAPKIQDRLRPRWPAVPPGHQHRACGPGPPWPGHAAEAPAVRGRGHASVPGHAAE